MCSMKKYLLFVILFCFSFGVKAQQDIQPLLGAWTGPQSGCDVGTAAYQIKMIAKNNTNSNTLLGNWIILSYQVNGGTIVKDSIPGLGNAAIWSFTFINNTYDFSACDDTFNIKTWVYYSLDPNHANDTLSYTFINSCTIVPGSITGGATVCQTGSSGTLHHVGYTNGWVADWQYNNAISGGWAPVPNPFVDTLNYLNTAYTTDYRVIRGSAYCPYDTSTLATIYVDSVSIAGLTSGSTSVCTGTNGGWIASNGVYGNIDDWEFNNGGGWTSMGATDSVQYTNLTSTLVYRYLVTNGVCPQDTSDTAGVFVSPLTIAGTLLQDDTLCTGPNSDTLFLVGNTGSVLDWEVDSGSGWTSLGVTDTFLILSNMTATSDYRVIVQSGVCPQGTTNSINMFVQNSPTITVGPDVTIYEGGSTQLSGTGGAAWVWSPGGTLSDSTLQAPWASPMVTTPYVYYAMSSNGCMNWDTTWVTVNPPAPAADSILITNLITANSDGINDTWNIRDIASLPGTAVKIWNLYGQEIYANEDYMNEWDGTYKGKQLPNGTYYYWVKLGVYDTEYKGTITLLGDE